MLLDLHRSLTFASRHVLSDAEAFSVLAMISYGLKRVLLLQLVKHCYVQQTIAVDMN